MYRNWYLGIAVFVVLLFLWVSFGYALFADQAALDQAWRIYHSLPLVVQVIVGLLFLPVTLGFVIWESAWPLWVRLLIVISLGITTLIVFFPHQPSARRTS